MSAITFPAVQMAESMAPTGHTKWTNDLGLALLPIVFVLSVLAAFVIGQSQPDESGSADDPASAPQLAAADAAKPVHVLEVLTPRMRAVMKHVARRYRVAESTLLPIFSAAQIAARQRELDPLLIVAVIGVESSFNPQAESTYGAQGLMQVVPRFHLDKVPAGAGEQPFFDPVTNVFIGGHVLQEAIRRRGSLVAGLEYYGGSSDPAAPYAEKVIAEKDRLEQAAGIKPPAA